MTPSASSPLVQLTAPEEVASRLFLFPWAGGGPSGYRRWTEAIPRRTEAWAVQPPGREARLDTAAYADLSSHVEEFVGNATSILDRPYVMFGHSMGAMVAWESARALQRNSLPPPTTVFLSGCTPLHQIERDGPDVSALPTEQFKKVVGALGGTPAELLENEEVMQLFLPTLRADFSAVHHYTYRDGPPVDADLVVLGGASDSEASAVQLVGWQELTTGRTEITMFPGNHFFIDETYPSIVDMIHDRLPV